MKHFFLFLFLTLNTLCYSESQLSRGIRIFYPNADSLHLYSLHHIHDSAQMRESAETSVYYHFKIHYKISGNGIHLIEEDNIKSKDLKEEKIHLKKAFKLPNGVYDIEIKIEDQNKVAEQIIKYKINKSEDFQAENILPLVQQTNEIIYNAFTYSENIKLYSPLLKNKSVYIRSYNQSGFMSPPPFNTADPRNGQMDFSTPEIKKKLQFDSEGFLSLEDFKKGLYVISPSLAPQPSFILLHSFEDFPGIEMVQSIVEPMRYICSSKEYTAMMEGIDIYQQRKAFEETWIKLAGNSKTRAKGLIKIYFNRVVFCNTTFTSYKEGWKTDRGMIFIVFGPPTYEEINDNKIIWTYGNKGAFNSLNFEFEKVEHSMSDNDYTLKRSPDFKTPWYVALESWRSGYVYRFK